MGAATSPAAARATAGPLMSGRGQTSAYVAEHLTNTHIKYVFSPIPRFGP